MLYTLCEAGFSDAIMSKSKIEKYVVLKRFGLFKQIFNVATKHKG